MLYLHLIIYHICYFMDLIDVIRTIIQQNPKTWAWNYNNMVPLPDNMGLFFQVNSKFQGYVMILFNPSEDLFNISFYDNNNIKILERKNVMLQQLVQVIHREVFKLQDSTDILMFCNSDN